MLCNKRFDPVYATSDIQTLDMDDSDATAGKTNLPHTGPDAVIKTLPCITTDKVVFKELANE